MPGPLPISLIIDDPAPVVNPLYYIETQVRHSKRPCQKSGEPMPSRIPLSLVERFASMVELYGARGKFSIIPYPAGLGCILDGWEGAPKSEIDAWLKVAKERIEPRMDITPEMLTHTCAMDLSTGRLLPESEREWSQKQSFATLFPYISLAFSTLRKAGFDVSGVTSPWDFAKDVEGDYARAILAAQRKVYERDFAWYFLGNDPDPKGRRSFVSLRDPDGGTVVHIVSKGHDFLWDTMETQETSAAYISSVADLFLDASATKGHLVELFKAETPIVFHTHWQSLHSNGRDTGLAALALVLKRVSENWGGKVRWLKCSELARLVAAGEA